jgi:glycosyltransferase involved in cell wall biosynthesis
MASRYEGLPCAVVEAMTAGLPVVATAVNAVPNVVIAGETGLLVPPGRPELLGRAIGYLLDNPAVAARLAAAARGRLGEDLTQAALGAVLAQSYQEAAP